MCSRLVLPDRGADPGKRRGVDLSDQRSPGGAISSRVPSHTTNCSSRNCGSLSRNIAHRLRTEEMPDRSQEETLAARRGAQVSLASMNSEPGRVPLLSANSCFVGHGAARPGARHWHERSHFQRTARGAVPPFGESRRKSPVYIQPSAPGMQVSRTPGRNCCCSR